MEENRCYTFYFPKQHDHLVLLTEQLLGLEYYPMVLMARRNKEGEYVYMALNPYNRYRFMITADQFASWFDIRRERKPVEEFIPLLDKMGCNGNLCFRIVRKLLNDMADIAIQQNKPLLSSTAHQWI